MRYEGDRAFVQRAFVQLKYISAKFAIKMVIILLTFMVYIYSNAERKKKFYSYFLS